jgi:hypothetical protein
MTTWVKMERRRTIMKDKCLYGTEYISSKYFEMGKCPEPYVRDQEGLIWVPSSEEPKFQKECPTTEETK